MGEGGGWDLLSGGQRGVQGAGHQQTGGGWEQQALLHRYLGEEKYLVDRMREQVMVAGDWMKMDKVKCVQEGEGGELPSVFRVIVQDG